jgi:hypothetical protein
MDQQWPAKKILDAKPEGKRRRRPKLRWEVDNDVNKTSGRKKLY